ncbi:hypothetical protein ZHAS_00019871 [Anopheles sinensis]|uniref:Uncharacterized protein n=1 Tax=Anopheles sinensis TaxID=74873 RepID=A0A084WMF2_ANOSI|nr:hypothetical protein ZHAS_00019871 [Anopheles sinensis]
MMSKAQSERFPPSRKFERECRHLPPRVGSLKPVTCGHRCWWRLIMDDAGCDGACEMEIGKRFVIDDANHAKLVPSMISCSAERGVGSAQSLSVMALAAGRSLLRGKRLIIRTPVGVLAPLLRNV